MFARLYTYTSYLKMLSLINMLWRKVTAWPLYIVISSNGTVLAAILNHLSALLFAPCQKGQWGHVDLLWLPITQMGFHVHSHPSVHPRLSVPDFVYAIYFFADFARIISLKVKIFASISVNFYPFILLWMIRWSFFNYRYLDYESSYPLESTLMKNKCHL